MKQVIFLDIDGTLFDATVKVPRSAKDAIRIARAQGHKVCICTGRPRLDVDESIRSIGFDGYIYSCGCVVEVEDTIIFQKTVSIKVLSQLLPVLTQKNIGFNLEGIEESYLDPQAMELFTNLFMNEQDMNSEMARHYMKKNKMCPYKDFVLTQQHNVVKISVFSSSLNDFKELEAVLPDEVRLTVHPFGYSDVYNGEISMRDIHKGTGIDHILSYFHHPLSHTIGIGDSMNDAEMLKHCQIGICMGNGSDELKKLSDEICPPIDQDGLYHSFMKHVLISTQ